MLTLPANPPGIRTLKSAETDLLREQYPDLPVSPVNCVTCKGKGSFRWLDESWEEPADYECPCDEQFILNRYLLHAGIGKHYQRLFWADADGVTDDVMGVVSEYTDNCRAYVDAGVGLMLYGRYGVGKTMISSLLLKSVLGWGIDGYFTTFHRMLDLFTEGWDQVESKRWFDKRIRHAGLLVIDDIGREHQGRNSIAESTLDAVLRSRIENSRATMITTNRNPDELATLYSGNALSMLSECVITHECKGTDFRPTQQGRLIDEAKKGLTRPVTLG